jgi:hypothetical protein
MEPNLAEVCQASGGSARVEVCLPRRETKERDRSKPQGLSPRPPQARNRSQMMSAPTRWRPSPLLEVGCQPGGLLLVALVPGRPVGVVEEHVDAGLRCVDLGQVGVAVGRSPWRRCPWRR